jgi:hypothetical protein
MELIKKAVKLGNSAGVILPKKLLGAEVKITVLNRPLNIRKVVLKLLENLLPDVLGIYLLSKEPIEVLVISSNIKKIIETGKIKISIVPLDLIKKDMKVNQKLRDKLEKASILLNSSLLKDLKKQS